MKFLKSFFHYTRIFWIISRLFLVLIFGYCSFFLLEGGDASDNFSAGFFALAALGFLWNFFAGIFKVQATKWTGFVLGGILILAGLFGLYGTINIFGFIDSAAFFLVALYFCLAGLFEIFGSRSRKIKTEDHISPELPVNLH